MRNYLNSLFSILFFSKSNNIDKNELPNFLNLFIHFKRFWYGWNCLFKFFPLVLYIWFQIVYNSHKTQFHVHVVVKLHS